jgi:hypothetical protein
LPSWTTFGQAVPGIGVTLPAKLQIIVNRIMKSLNQFSRRLAFEGNDILIPSTPP